MKMLNQGYWAVCLTTYCLFHVACSDDPLSDKSKNDKISNVIQSELRDNKLILPNDGSIEKSDNPPQDFDFRSLGLSEGLSKYLNNMYSSSYFLHGFIASLAVIIVSELGDKTFFIAAIMAMRHSRLTVLSGALSALAVMTVLASLVGHILSMIPRVITYYASSILFLIFGIRMFMEARKMSDSEGMEEMEEVQQQLKKTSDSEAISGLDPEKGVFIGTVSSHGGFIPFLCSLHRRVFSKVFLQAFTLTFLAEWGDRSQVATVILAAREHVGAVIIGGTLGHALCTGLAVLGGRMIAQRISVKAVTYIGSVVFIIFGVSAFFFAPEKQS